MIMKEVLLVFTLTFIFIFLIFLLKSSKSTKHNTIDKKRCWFNTCTLVRWHIL